MIRSELLTGKRLVNQPPEPHRKGRSQIARAWHNFDGWCPTTSAAAPFEKQSARIAAVEPHIQLENQHDLEGVVSTFGDTAQYDDEPWDEHYGGRSRVRELYKLLMTALPDLEMRYARSTSPMERL